MTNDLLSSLQSMLGRPDFLHNRFIPYAHLWETIKVNPKLCFVQFFGTNNSRELHIWYQNDRNPLVYATEFVWRRFYDRFLSYVGQMKCWWLVKNSIKMADEASVWRVNDHDNYENMTTYCQKIDHRIIIKFRWMNSRRVVLFIWWSFLCAH